MNVYFIDPTYVKSEGWKPLLTFLKVKAVYSFIPKEELPESLISIINPYLKAAYFNQDFKIFSDNCAYWLRAHFEKHIHLLTEDYKDINNIPKEELKKYSSRSPYNNIMNLESENCLILLKLNSSYDYRGIILAPECYVDVLQESNLPTHVAKYCLNILHKKHQHSLYQNQSSFVVFDKYFSRTFCYNPRFKRWDYYSIKTKEGRSINLMNPINRSINTMAPDDFPLIDKDGKKYFTLIRSEDGDAAYQQFINEANERAEEYEEQQRDIAEGMSWQEEVAEMNRAFWRECGEAGSNCESWPGWD
jgi:hypothetical protein